MYYMLLQKGKKKGAITVGAGTSGQVAACGRVASAGGGSGSTAGKGNGATGRGNGATGTGSVAGGNGASSSGGGASRKAKVVMVPTIEKVIERIAAKKQKKIIIIIKKKKISDEYVFILKQLCWYGIYYKTIKFIMYLVRTLLVFYLFC
jgi:hypothetical protein